jgi:U2 small nuclear ribonucleoprotein B''
MATRAPPPGLPAKVASVPPNQTLYVTNLPSAKIQKEDLRTALYMLFSTYGAVLDVVALKTMKMRGQAHIVYKDIQTATQAMRSLDGFEFFGQEMKISYAKSKSNIIAKLDGTFKIPTASTAARVEVTDLQQSIFNAPVPGAPATTTGLPSKPAGADHVMTDAGTPESRGVKRPREEEEQEGSDSDVAMEEESDDE